MDDPFCVSRGQRVGNLRAEVQDFFD